MGGPPLGLVTDLDGTLAPLQEYPSWVVISSSCKTSLHCLAMHLALVAVLSGRLAEETQGIVEVEGVLYLGNHGLEQWWNGRTRILEGAEPFLRLMQKARAILGTLSLPGVYLEDKGIVMAMHYRHAHDPIWACEEIQNFAEPLVRALGLRITHGKMVVEVRPPVEVDKGTTLRALVQEYGLANVILLGDDLTDVDAFLALHQMIAEGRVHGLAIGVLGQEAPAQLIQEADLTLDGILEAEQFLDWLADRVTLNDSGVSR